MRGGLWARWRYAGRYAGLAATTRRARFSRWAALVPGDEPDDVTALTRVNPGLTPAGGTQRGAAGSAPG